MFGSVEKSRAAFFFSEAKNSPVMSPLQLGVAYVSACPHVGVFEAVFFSL